MGNFFHYWPLAVAVAMLGLAIAALGWFRRRVARDRMQDEERSMRALAMARHAAGRLSKGKKPRRWVRAQMQMAMLLTEIGGRSHDRVLFEEALEILKGAMPVLKAEGLTPELATALYYRGRAEWGLGGFEVDCRMLEAAVATFRELLEIRPWPRHLLYGVVISLPAVIIVDIGDRKDRPESMDEGVELARQGVAASRRRISVECCITWRNLCHALAVAGRRKGDPTMLEEAVEFGRKACEIVRKSRYPGQWAASHASLGYALGALGENNSDERLMREAIEALEKAISVTGMKLPREGRSMLSQSLGGVRLSLFRLTGDASMLRQSIEDLCAALGAFEEAGQAYARAETARMLGDALTDAGENGDAAALYRSALETFEIAGAVRQIDRTRAALAGLGREDGSADRATHVPVYQVK